MTVNSSASIISAVTNRAKLSQEAMTEIAAVTRVVHCKREPFDVYIGRPSVWGNPFVIGVHGSRSEVIEKYRAYILASSALLAELSYLRGKTLGCYCAPKACHGDVLAELAAVTSPPVTK
jgi:hypothetical protein